MILIITFNYAVFILYIKEAVNYFFIPFGNFLTSTID